jgi:hypothetical protein
MRITITISEIELAQLRAQARYWIVTANAAPVTEIIRRLLAKAPPVGRASSRAARPSSLVSRPSTHLD